MTKKPLPGERPAGWKFEPTTAATSTAQPIKRHSKHIDAFEQRHKIDGEDVIDWHVAVRKGELSGVVVLTSRRLVYLRKGTFGDKSEPFPLEKISSVEITVGILLVEVVLHTSGDKIALQLPRGNGTAEAFLRRVQDALHNSSPTTAAAVSQAQPDPMLQLEGLAKLHANGILTDEEFSVKKAELLSRI